MPKEIVFRSNSKVELVGYEEEPLGTDQIRGSTICSLVSQGTELAWLDGSDFPIRPGYGAVFQVEEMGSRVVNTELGQLRFCMGAHRSAQQHQECHTLPLPGGLAAETAVIARLMAVSVTTLMTTKARPGDKVVVTGSGPVGILAAHAFSVGGYDVSLVEPDPLRREQAARSGISRTFEAMPLGDSKMRGQVAIVVECSGNESAVLEGCRMVRQMGEVVVVGVPWRQMTEISAHEILKEVFFNYVQLRSGWEWQVPILSRGFVWEELLEGYNNSPHSTFSGFARSMRWLAEGRVKLDGLIRKVEPDTPNKAYAAIRKRSIPEPFIVFDWLDGGKPDG